MLFKDFHFAAPFWLWGIAMVPVVWAGYALFYRSSGGSYNKLKDFADPHLLPHLLEGNDKQNLYKHSTWRSLLLWLLIWVCVIMAMAEPRWNYTQVKAFAPARSLVVLLDLSRSMDSQDVKPSRLVRARQEIEDVLRFGKGIRFGLIAFDAAPHIIAPLSDDVQTIKQLLPSLTTDIVYTQGAHLSSALQMAGEMLKNAHGKEKYVLVLSDGGFSDSDAAILRAEQKLRVIGAQIHVMGFGTKQGAPIPDGKNGLVKNNGKTVISKLEEARLRRVAVDGGGVYISSSYLDNDTKALLSHVQILGAAGKETQKTTRFWEEHFYIFLFPVVLLVLPWFRKNATFPVLIAMLLVMQIYPAYAFEWKDLFLNKAQQGEKAVKEQKFDKAVERFNDPYRKGVALYKSGNYGDAAKFFGQSGRKNIQDSARYNLGNAQLKGGKIEDAIKSYEELLKDNPEHKDAKYNLEIAKKLLELQKQKDKEEQQKNKNQKQNKQKNSKQKNNSEKKQNNEKNNSQQNEQKKDNARGASKKQPQQQQNDSENSGKKSAEQNSAQDKQQGHKQQKQSKQQQKEGGQGKSADEKPEKEQEQKQDSEKQNSGVDKSRKSKGGDSKDKKLQNEKKNGESRNGGKAEKNKSDMSTNVHKNMHENVRRDKSDVQTGEMQVKPRTQKDIDVDQWLNRVKSNPDEFLKNKFYIESQRAGVQKGGGKSW